jgi:hypothetical protein
MFTSAGVNSSTRNIRQSKVGFLTDRRRHGQTSVVRIGATLLSEHTLNLIATFADFCIVLCTQRNPSSKRKENIKMRLRNRVGGGGGLAAACSYMTQLLALLKTVMNLGVS